MAKAKASNESKKITFGVRRKGKHSKTSGPKDRRTKKSRGQG
jgi:hypothetical protein